MGCPDKLSGAADVSSRRKCSNVLHRGRERPGVMDALRDLGSSCCCPSCDTAASFTTTP